MKYSKKHVEIVGGNMVRIRKKNVNQKILLPSNTYKDKEFCNYKDEFFILLIA